MSADRHNPFQADVDSSGPYRNSLFFAAAAIVLTAMAAGMGWGGRTPNQTIFMICAVTLSVAALIAFFTSPKAQRAT